MIKLVTNQTYVDSSYTLATIEECLEYVSTRSVLGLDIETTRKYNKYLKIEGLDPHTSDIVMLQIGDEEEQYIIDTRNVDITLILPILTDPEIMLVGHNIKFEYKHILSKYGVRINNLYDTMLAEKILTNGYFLLVSLKDLLKRYLNIDVDKTIRLQFLTIGSRPFTDNEIKYGAEDIELPLKIRKIQLEKLQQENLFNCAKLEFRFVSALAEIEYNGINFNSEKWLETYEENLISYGEKIEQLDDFVLNNYSTSKFVDRQLALFSTGFTCDIKWSSSKQVVEFFKYLGYCPKAVSKTTKKLSYTVEAKEVESLLTQEGIPEEVITFIKLYLRSKEVEQSVTTFGKKFLKHVNPITGRIHSNFNQIVRTGRISSSSPNNQNIPSNDRFRRAFDSPEGKVIVNADYSGQENIVLANKALDPDILRFYDEGLGDMHCFVASKLFNISIEDFLEAKQKKDDKIPLNDYEKDLLFKRQIAKSAGFALAYGGDGHTIAKNLGIPKKQGEKVYNDYFKAFPGLLTYFEINKRASLKQGYILIDNVTRRKFYYKDIKALWAAEYRGDYKTINRLKGQMERASQNYPIQGESGSITKYATVLLYDWLLANKLQEEIKIVLLVHDEINLEVTESYKDLAAEKLSFFMEEAGKVWCKRVPLKADSVISDYWTH